MLNQIFFTIILIGWCSNVFAQDKPPQTFNAQGVSIEFTAKQLVAGGEATVQFRITGTNGTVPLTNLRPVAWLDQRQEKEAPSARECREKVQSFLQPSFSKRPTID